MNAALHVILMGMMGGCPISEADSFKISQLREVGDYNQVVKLLEPCAQLGNVKAEFSIGYYMLEWLEDPSAKSKARHQYADAIEWVYKAALSGSDQAVGLLHKAYRFGMFDLPRDQDKMQCWADVQSRRLRAESCEKPFYKKP